MSRLTQRAPVAPECLPLSAGHNGTCDKISWLPEGRVFSNVQRQKISKFLKRSVLKRVFGSQQQPLRWDGSTSKKEESPAFPDTRKKAEAEPAPDELLAQHAEGPAALDCGALEEDKDNDAWGFETEGTFKKQRSSYNKMGKRDDENADNSPHVSSISQETLNQGVFRLWSYPCTVGSTTDNREFKKTLVDASIINSAMRLLAVNHSLARTPGDKHVGSYPGQLMPVGLCWPYADGDFLRNKNGFYVDSCSTTETIGVVDTLFPPNWRLKCGISSMEENGTDESDLSENEKMSDTLLTYFKKMDLNLKPETIQHVEESFTEEPNEVFTYADFLPPPFSTLDLHKCAFSKFDNWKALMDPPDFSMERLISRLLELERLQHTTIQKEKQRLQSTLCPPVVLERPSSSKAIAPKAKPAKLSEPLGLQTPSVDKSREKKKNNPGSGKLEQNASKWNSCSAGKCKSSSRPSSLKCQSAPRQLATAHEDPKNSKCSILNSCQELTAKHTSAPTQPLVKTMSVRCLLPRSPKPVSPLPLSLPESQREEVKVPRTKKKLHRKSLLLNRSFYLQKQNCFFPSFMVKGKCSPIDQK